MYALIYDEHLLDKPNKKVISIHASRTEADKALDIRMKSLGKTVYECHTRIVWIEREIKAGDFVRPGEYDTWRPGETIPEGELFSDSD
jgi:hypothetical protein